MVTTVDRGGPGPATHEPPPRAATSDRRPASIPWPRMGYRDQETATRARVEQLEKELGEARERLALRADLDASSPKGSGPGSRKAALLLSALAFSCFGGAYYAGFVVSGRVGEQVGSALGMAGLVSLALTLMMVVVSQLLFVVPPNQVAVISGRSHRMADGTIVGYRTVAGGRALRLPLLERVDYISLSQQPIELSVLGAYARGGTPLDIRAYASIKVARDERRLGHAIERFLGRDATDRAQVARETLEGAVRGVVAMLSVDELLGDRLKFEHALKEEVEDDMSKLGFVLDTFTLRTIDRQ